MQFYDVYRARVLIDATDQPGWVFVMRAELRVITLVYRWHRAAEERIIASGPASTMMHGNGKHEDVLIVPVLDDWSPRVLTTGEGVYARLVG